MNSGVESLASNELVTKFIKHVPPVDRGLLREFATIPLGPLAGPDVSELNNRYGHGRVRRIWQGMELIQDALGVSKTELRWAVLRSRFLNQPRR